MPCLALPCLAQLACCSALRDHLSSSYLNLLHKPLLSPLVSRHLRSLCQAPAKTINTTLHAKLTHRQPKWHLEASALKSLSLVLRFIQFGCAAVILAIFSYFLATLHNHDLPIDTYIRAVEGISGAAVLYTIFALLLVCCLGGIAFFSLLGMLLDLSFCGAFIYVAYATRGGNGSCRGYVNTPFGSGNTNDNTVPQGNGGFTRLPSLHTACRLETACFAVAIVAVVFFLLSIPVELGLIKHRRKEKAFGPSPNNGYTAGSPKRKFWQRKQKRNTMYEKNADALPTHATPADFRTSYATDTTAIGAGEAPLNKYGNVTSYGHQTATTTHTPGAANDGYVRTHQPYNNNPTGTF